MITQTRGTSGRRGGKYLIMLSAILSVMPASRVACSSPSAPATAVENKSSSRATAPALASSCLISCPEPGVRRLRAIQTIPPHLNGLGAAGDLLDHLFLIDAGSAHVHSHALGRKPAQLFDFLRHRAQGQLC